MTQRQGGWSDGVSRKLTRLETQVSRIYREVNKFADAHGGVECGMNVLYGPPIANPLVFIVSMQGGGADKNRQRKWPPKLLYMNNKHEFGRRLRSDFEEADLCDVLEEKTVATNIAFPQAKEFAKWRSKPGSDRWLAKSLEWVEELIRLMPPRVLLTYGADPFRYLMQRKKISPVERTIWRPSSPDAPQAPVPLVGCGHLMRGATKAQRREAMQLVLAIINAQ